MTYRTTSWPRESYPVHSGYSVYQPLKPAYDSLLQWPQHGYFDSFRPDAALLREALCAYAGSQDSTLAEQIFGNQARQQRISLRHLANILYERALLHKNHLKDIDGRLMDCHERLSILKMHFPLDMEKSQQNLEKLIIELEKQRRDEELAFWKDSTEVRQQLFENAATYSATRRREDILCGVEAEYGR